MSLRNAFAYLTALRIPPRARTPLSHSLHYFPWVGAAIGSLNVLFFLAVSRVVPAPAACLFAVVFPQALAGFSPWRGVMEAARGIRTLPGHGFPPGFRLDLLGSAVVAALILGKWTALGMLPPDWRVRAVFIFPILGLCARTAAFLWETRGTPARPGHGSPRDSVVARRRVRAGFLSGVLLFLAFLFPARAAVILLLTGAGAAWGTLRARHPGRAADDTARMTLQTAALVSEVAEAAVLAGLVAAGLVAFRF